MLATLTSDVLPVHPFKKQELAEIKNRIVALQS